MEKKSSMHPDKWVLFLRDDGFGFNLEWAEWLSKGEDGLVSWKLADGSTVITCDGYDFRTEVCRNPFWRDPFGSSAEVFRVYRARVGDLNAWTWGTLPGKRLDEALISRLVQGRYAEKELDHLQEDGAPMDLKKILLIAGVALVGIAAVYFLVLPQFKGDKKEETTPPPAQQQTDNTTASGHWVQGDNGLWTWVED